MIQLFMRPQVGRQSTTRRFFSAVSSAVRSVVAPGSLLERPAEPVAVPEPAGLFEADELPAIEEIEAAAADYDQAADQARAAERAKRKARRLLDKLPAGRYGSWLVSRAESNRLTVDLDAVRAHYRSLGLDVPMKAAAPSLRVERAELLAEVAS